MSPHDALARSAGDAGLYCDLVVLRSEIDHIDDALLSLMEQRLDLSLAIARLKQGSGENRLRLRPRREREVLQRVALGARRMPNGAIDAIWRELMAVSLQAQQETALVLHAAAQPVLATSLARQRFGCAAPIVVAGSPEEALVRALRGNSIAVVELNPLSGWWLELCHDRALRLFDVLREEGGRVCAVAVGRVTEDELPQGISFPIISEATLRQRIAMGEAIRPLAICGHMRLCLCDSTQTEGGAR